MTGVGGEIAPRHHLRTTLAPLIHEFSIMSEPIDPLSRKMATSTTPRSFTFRKFRGENLKAQFLSHVFTDFVHFTQVYLDGPKLHSYQK